MAPITPRTPDYEYSPLPLPPMTTQQGKGVVRTKTAHVDAGYVDPSLTEESQDPTLQQSGWTSTYLKKTTLLGFAVIFLCLLLGVIALAVVDAKQDGIANAKSSEHYLWTYGPTAGTINLHLQHNKLTGSSASHRGRAMESNRIQGQRCDALGSPPERPDVRL